MLYLTCTVISGVDLACYGVSYAKDWVSVDYGTRTNWPGRVVQSVGHLTRKSGVLGSIPGLATYFVSPSAFSRRAVVSYWRKYVHKVLVNRLGG